MKKLKAGQLCTIVDKRTGDRYVVQAKRYCGIDYSICSRCVWENTPLSTLSTLCIIDRLKITCYELFGSKTYPKIIKHVKNS